MSEMKFVVRQAMVDDIAKIAYVEEKCLIE